MTMRAMRMRQGLGLAGRAMRQHEKGFIISSNNLSTAASELSAEADSDGLPKKVVVVGGNGFVGSAVCRAAVQLGVQEVLSVSRSGPPKAEQLAKSDWAQQVAWMRGDALEASDWPEEYLNGASGVISCVGSFGSHAFMRKVCGTANVKVLEAAKESGVNRAVFISAHDFGAPLRNILRGYFEGKQLAEQALFSHFKHGTGVAVRPGMVHGTRYVNLSDSKALPVPLSLVGKPMEVVLGNSQVMGFTQGAMPAVLRRLLVPAVSADAIGRASVSALLDPIPEEFQQGEEEDTERVIDVWDLTHC